MPDWLEQYFRTMRWYKRLRALQQRPAHEITESDRDDIYAFFQNCWHLKDWIKRDKSLEGKVRTPELNQYTEKTVALKLCQQQ